jgi:hypothetical protein
MESTIIRFLLVAATGAGAIKYLLFEWGGIQDAWSESRARRRRRSKQTPRPARPTVSYSGEKEIPLSPSTVVQPRKRPAGSSRAQSSR